MGDAVRRTPPELEIIAESEAGSADAPRRDDLGAWHGGHDVPKVTKECGRVSRSVKRCHPVNPPLTGFAAHMVVPEPSETGVSQSCSVSTGGEALDPAAGGGFAHVNVAAGVDAHPVRAQELAELAPSAAELPHDLEVAAAQDPHLVVGAVGEVEPTLLRVG